MIRRLTYRVLMLVAIVLTIATSTAYASSSIIVQREVGEQITKAVDSSDANISRESAEQPLTHFAPSRHSLLLATDAGHNSPSSPTIASRIMRVDVRTTARHSSQVLHSVRSIDATTTTQRYGLYNHKILFVSIARHHYICRLRRLII